MVCRRLHTWFGVLFFFFCYDRRDCFLLARLIIDMHVHRCGGGHVARLLRRVQVDLQGTFPALRIPRGGHAAHPIQSCLLLAFIRRRSSSVSSRAGTVLSLLNSLVSLGTELPLAPRLLVQVDVSCLCAIKRIFVQGGGHGVPTAGLVNT